MHSPANLGCFSSKDHATLLGMKLFLKSCVSEGYKLKAFLRTPLTPINEPAVNLAWHRFMAVVPLE